MQYRLVIHIEAEQLLSQLAEMQSMQEEQGGVERLPDVK